MSRATDLCTCGKTRDDHGFYDTNQHSFFPNPQPPPAPKVSFEKKLQEFLESQGEVHRTNLNFFFVKELDGTVWEVQAFIRKDPAASQEGV